MVSLLHIHFITFLLVLINVLIFSKKISNDLASKYFLTNYIYHKHKNISCFLISYPFLIIMIYFLVEDIFPLSSLFIAVLHVYFLYEITSKRNMDRKEAYIAWYKKNVKHSFSFHSYDMIRKDFRFLNEKIARVFLFKFEFIFFLSIVIETEILNELFTIADSMK